MNKIICFDIESCDGGSVGSLCSLGFVTAEAGEITDKQDLLVNPACGFNPMLLKGKHFKLQYPKSVYRASPGFKHYYERIKSLFATHTVVGFSVANDVKYLNDACMFYGLDFIDYDFFDIQTLLALHLDERRNYSLADAAARYGVKFTAHSSADDAEASYKVLHGILTDEGLSLEQFLEKYSVRCGTNRNGVIYPCRSPYPAVAIATDSKSAIARLNAEFLRDVKRQSGELNGKRFCFSEELELVPEFRSIVSALYARGATYTGIVQECNCFVSASETGKRQTVAQIFKKNRITLDELKQILGKYPLLIFDDEQILLDEKARKQRDRITEYTAQKHGSTKKNNVKDK